ncbi:MAG: nuclear transport factor 2 family protein [Rhodothermia bacterium]|nr:nuclear transport factor 2 family protein [Rhodothermia bacterium]
MYGMIGEGNVTEAFEKYYHDDVVMQEPAGEPRRGKEANRQFMQQWMTNVEERHGGGVTAITSNEDEHITMVETWSDVTYSGKRMKMEEVAVQRWEGEQIIHERFYYTMPE